MKNWVRNNKGFLAFLVLFGVFRTAVADWNPIPSASMHPNLLEGDVVLVNRLAFDLKVPLTDVVLAHLGEPQRGDIVTFRSPRDGTLLIKRVVALPGDWLYVQNNHVYLGKSRTGQFVEQKEPFIAKGTPCDELCNLRKPIQVPPDHFFMMGDNRGESDDSRDWGPVPKKWIIGRAFFTYWPPNRIGTL